MAKPNKKYPRKLRQKLERIANERVNRGDNSGPEPTLAMDFLGSKSVGFMHAVIDDTSRDPREWKLRIRHTLDTNHSRTARTIKTVELVPPWERSTTTDRLTSELKASL